MGEESSRLIPTGAGGPFFEDLRRGQVFQDAPGVMLTTGHAAVHQAVVGDRLRLALDGPLCLEVTGRDRMLVHPNLRAGARLALRGGGGVMARILDA